MTHLRTMAPVTEQDWYARHRDYDVPATALARRLAAVQEQVRAALDAARDLLPQICDWFASRGFAELWVSDPAEGWGAAAHRFTGTPGPLEQGARMFTFRGHHPRTGPVRHLSLSMERIVVPAARSG
jgi:hypothetical protein